MDGDTPTPTHTPTYTHTHTHTQSFNAKRWPQKKAWLLHFRFLLTATLNRYNFCFFYTQTFVIVTKSVKKRASLAAPAAL